MAKNRLAKAISPSTGPVEAVSPRPTKKQLDERRRYRAEDALRDITRAEAHKRDRELMRDVKQCAREQTKVLGSVLGKK